MLLVSPNEPNSLENALKELRERRTGDQAKEKQYSIAVAFEPGSYEITHPIELGPEDGFSSSDVFPRLSFCVRNAESGKSGEVHFVGGKTLRNWKLVNDKTALDRLPNDDARKAVMQCDLKALGITDYGTLKRRGFGRPTEPAALELFFDGQPMTLARWPNNDWARIADVPAGAEGKFIYEGDQPAKWSRPGEVWIHGYWTWDWADSFEQVGSIDPQTKEISTVAPHGVYGYKKGARFYALNILEELDQPGEYYVDRESGVLYFWPPKPIDSAPAQVSLLEGPMFIINGAQNVSINGITFECTRGAGVQVTNADRVTVSDCTFRNIGTNAITMDGKDSSIRNCVMYNLGDGGISISGGDRMTLTPGNLVADNNEIHDYSLTVRTYTSAINVSGVGNTVSHNLIYNAPHMAIGLGGNDHIIEYNEVHHVCMETHDAGAFYMGRDWTQRGNVVRYNFMHEMGNGDVQAIYLDDWTSGVMVYGNICHGARRGVLVGGGRDNIIDNNIFVNCGTGVHIDQRGLGWAKNYFNGETPTLFDRMKDVKGDQPPYTDKYPELKTLLNDEPVLAKGNKVIHNINVGDNFLDLTDGLTEETPYLEIKDNFTEGDPGFLDAAKHDYRLKPNSPAFGKGFKELPFEKMGRNGPSILK
ncbi:MAG: right-handed parallel beta-helix repeat-containing protein [Candidatus Hydrogenedentes bacterium]|nr:right-handed parallel beta-helix repeat-containing protein [Candidatus Hydrogenedentota bacterium]